MVPCHLTRIHHRESRSGVTGRDVTIRSPVTVWNGDCTVWLSIFCGGSVSIPFYRFLWIGIRSMQQTADAFLSWARHGNQGPYYTAGTTQTYLRPRKKEITYKVWLQASYRPNLSFGSPSYWSLGSARWSPLRSLARLSKGDDGDRLPGGCWKDRMST